MTNVFVYIGDKVYWLERMMFEGKLVWVWTELG